MLHPMQNSTSVHRQRVIVVASVLLLHVLALWALQTGLLQRVMVLAEEIVVPVEFITPAVPPVIKPPPVLPKPPPSIRPPVAAPTPTPTPPVAPAPAPMPLAIADPTPSANAPVGVTHAPIAVAPVVVAPTPAAPAPAPKVELPSSDAEYLHNPKTEYPRISRQRNEQGKVVVSVFIGIDGMAQKAEIKVSSGFERLDQAALATAKSWRYVPGKRGGVPEAMWFNVPINFVLE
jgi:protein TonB